MKSKYYKNNRIQGQYVFDLNPMTSAPGFVCVCVCVFGVLRVHLLVVNQSNSKLNWMKPENCLANYLSWASEVFNYIYNYNLTSEYNVQKCDSGKGTDIDMSRNQPWNTATWKPFMRICSDAEQQKRSATTSQVVLKQHLTAFADAGFTLLQHRKYHSC